MSASTGAPADRARWEGARLATNGTAVATAATPPAAEVATSSRRRLESTFSSVLMTRFLKLEESRVAKTLELYKKGQSD
jgi:hypothetical protein